MGIQDARGDDVIAYYAGTLGFTRALDVGPTSTMIPDAEGALEPGRYLVQLLDCSASGMKAWLAFGAFARAGTVVAAAGPPHFPLGPRGLIALEFNVRKGDNDRVAVIGDGGTARLYLTRISRSD